MKSPAPTPDKTPKPLIQCEAPQLDWSRPGTPAASGFGDIYFSVDGGMEETRTVFLEGCGLPDGWQGREVFTIGELGFGSGLNFLAAWQMWETTAPKTAHLHFISFEKFPFSRDELTQALRAWPELEGYASQLIAQWPARVKGFHRLHFDNVTLTLIHDDILAGLDSLSARVDAWFLDGFSPAKNPDMWSLNVMEKIAALSAPRARLATFTVAGAVRNALTQAGFDVEKKTGFGRKRHRLEARLSSGMKTPKTARPQTPTIIGSGIGGASLARAFLRRGITPHIITQGNARAASGNPAALIKPRLDLQDRPEARFFLSSYLYALGAYQGAYEGADVIISRGITHIPKTQKEAERFEKLARQAPLPREHLEWTGEHLSLPNARAISPQAALDSFMDGAEIVTDKAEDLSRIDGPVFCAAGYGIKALLGDNNPPLRYSRGQISWAENPDNAPLQSPISYGGYAIPRAGQLLIGATHDRLGPDDPFMVRGEDDLRNFEQFEMITGQTLRPASQSSRASVRVTTANTLPMIMRPAHDRYILTGLGSRGFVFAPLLAEAIVCHYLGEPLPIDKALWARFAGHMASAETSNKT